MLRGQNPGYQAEFDPTEVAERELPSPRAAIGRTRSQLCAPVSRAIRPIAPNRLPGERSNTGVASKNQPEYGLPG